MCNAFECFLQLEHFTDYSIREYQSILDELSSSFWNFTYTLAYYAFYYAGIFDAGLACSIVLPFTTLM